MENRDFNLDESVVQHFFEDHQFFLVYQKKVSLENPEKVVGLEAYLRLKNSGMEAYSPAIFMPVVRRMGLLPQVMLESARQVVEDWTVLQLMEVDTSICINVDIETFENLGVLKQLVDQINASPMPLASLEVDIVYNSPLSVSEAAEQGMRYLRGQGVQFNLELVAGQRVMTSELQRVAVKELKLPRSFFTDGADPEHTAETIQYYLDQAKALGLRLTAVGIEDEDTAATLMQLGVDCGQGYLYGKPVGLKELDSPCTEEEARDEALLSILVLENENDIKSLLRGALPDIYNLVTASVLDDPLASITELSPDVVVVEVLPGDDAVFSMVEKAHQLFPDKFLSVIFVADVIDPKQFIQCYECEGFALLAKTDPIMEFISTINRAINVQKSNKRLASMAEQSTALALQSMQDASHYGDIVHLMKAICLANSESEITRPFFQFMNQRDLLCSIFYRNGDQINSFDSKNITCTPTEVNVFEVLSTKGRLYEFKQRIMVNSDSVSFLIKNLPGDDNEKGQIRDYIAVIIECMDARYKSILQNRTVQSTMDQLLEITKSALASVEGEAVKKKEIVELLNSEIGMSFHVLDLTLDQENYLRELVEKLVNEYDWDTESTAAMVGKLQTTIDQLASIAVAAPEADEPVVSFEEESDDVELF